MGIFYRIVAYSIRNSNTKSLNTGHLNHTIKQDASNERTHMIEKKRKIRIDFMF